MRRCLAVLFLATALAWAGGIVANQSDDFEDGGTADWSEGGSSPNPPTNVPSGGPAGNGDHFLQNVSTGDGGPGSRQVMFNRAQWTGDFLSAGVRQIQLDARNLGATDLYVRIAIEGGPGPSQWCASAPLILPAMSGWAPAVFDLDESSMVRVSGIDDLPAVLASVSELRVLSAQSGPSWVGDLVAATLGIDNVFASTVPVELQTFTVE